MKSFLAFLALFFFTLIALLNADSTVTVTNVEIISIIVTVTNTVTVTASSSSTSTSSSGGVGALPPPGSSSQGPFQGKARYEIGSTSNIGSCGISLDIINNTYNDWIVGLSDYFMPTTGDPNKNTLCGSSKCVVVTGPNGKVAVKITDTALNGATVDNRNNINLSQKAFAVIGSVSDGVETVSWSIVDCGTVTLGKQ